ncbi:response regulator [Streptomyces griseoflavus]|uniref:response regulator n=1 Tax=Streptomyces griseoflavus TaxID=35619 RepID=UPI001982E6C3|nr:response regulator [Streptomyces griseoflavus]GGV22489.1 transcriptional regulatory protein [Streptomyces griseoflavus]
MTSTRGDNGDSTSVTADATVATDAIDVLVVDDDFRVARVHRAYVERLEAFRVVGVAGSGAQALAAVDELRPDLVLLDLYLPDVFGLDVIPRLRTAGHDCDVMVVSAAREAEAVRGAVRQGVVDYLLKPFDFEDLRGRLERYAVQRGRMLGTVVRGQADVDRVLAGAAAGPVAPVLPKGMSAETAGLIERTLREAEGSLSATECAGLTGVSRVSARRYLEYFHTAGSAEVSLRYGATGRPERRYRFVGAAGGLRAGSGARTGGEVPGQGGPVGVVRGPMGRPDGLSRPVGRS